LDLKNSPGEVLAHRFEQILYKLAHASKTLSEANEIAHHMLIRIKAITNPTSELRLKVVSLPDMEILGRQFTSRIMAIKQDLLQMEELSHSLASEISSGGIKCQTCKGDGVVAEERVQREDDHFIVPYEEYIPCSDCKGLGVLNLPADLLRSAYILVDNLKSTANLLR